LQRLKSILFSTTPLNPRLSIVILNWNGKSYLEQFLPSVLSTTYSNKEIVVIDNASTDGSVSFIKEKYPGIVLVHNKENYGFAKGYNEGLKHVDADYYLLLNSDVEVQKGWVEPIITLMESDSQIAACQPKLLQYNNRNMFEYSGGAGGWLDRFGYPFARGRIFDVCEKDTGQYDAAAPIFWASGAALCVRASVYKKLHGFDEFFFAHQEEIDFCWRAQRAGYKIYCCPLSVVYHVGGGTLPKGNRQKVFLNFRNNLVMMAKNLPAHEATWKISWRFVLDAISAVKSLLTGEVTYFTAVFHAHLAFLGWLISGKKQQQLPLNDNMTDGYLKRSIVWQHFILGKKKFSEMIKTKR